MLKQTLLLKLFIIEKVTKMAFLKIMEAAEQCQQIIKKALLQRR